MKKSKSLFKTSAAALAVLHIINKLVDLSALSDLNKKTNGKFYHWKHGDIFYTVSDKDSNSLKKPLLLIHDLTVFSSNHEWNQIIEDLSKEYVVYAFDLVGCGKSEKPEITYTNYYYVQLIQDFIKDIIKEPTKVITSGFSLSMVLMADSIDKNLFTDITAINPKTINFYKKTPDERSKIIMNLFHLPIIGKTVYYMKTCRQNVEYYLTEDCFYNPFNLKKSTSDAYYNAAHSSMGKGRMLLASLEGSYLNIDITNALKNTEKEITIILGEYNKEKDEVESSYLKYKPEIEIKVIPKAKLLPQLETPEELLSALE